MSASLVSADRDDRVQRAADQLASEAGVHPKVGVVLGSGLGAFGEHIDDAVRVPYERVEGLPPPKVAGHAGQFVLGRVEGTPVAVMQGRVHLYEGYPVSDVVLGVRILRALGVQTLVVTNAAGGIDPAIAPGELMVIADHLNLTGHNPLMGPNDPELGARFPDMTEAYDASLRALLHRAGRDIGIVMHEGVYAGMLGPSYETPAEVRMLGRLGAQAVGMSTVLEVIAARHAGLRVAGISCITNRAAGLSGEPLTHEEVQATANAAAGTTVRLLRAFVKELA